MRSQTSRVVLYTSCLFLAVPKRWPDNSVCLSSASSALGPSSLCLQSTGLTCSEHAFVEEHSSILALGYRVSPRSSSHCLTIVYDSKDEIEMSETVVVHVFVLP